MTVLVTGAAGSVGRRLIARLPRAAGTDSAWYDRHLDVTDREEVEHWFKVVRPELVYHLAGAKHAFEGELDPGRVAEINITGTANVISAARRHGSKVVFSSTCKACDPETAYGASKLIAERLVLNAGGVVVRYYNIPESDGNVFRHWESLLESEPIPYTSCWRYFISMEQALTLTLAGAELASGRYVVDPGLPQHMRIVAERLYPGRALVEVPRRRGDRAREPLHAACEEMWPIGLDGLYAVRSPYDVQDEPVAADALAVA